MIFHKEYKKNYNVCKSCGYHGYINAKDRINYLFDQNSTETILQDALNEYGGNLIRFDISTARAIGSKNLWQPAYPITQWSIEK